MSLLLPLKPMRTEVVSRVEVFDPIRLKVWRYSSDREETLRLHGIYLPDKITDDWRRRAMIRLAQYCSGNTYLLATIFAGKDRSGEAPAIISMRHSYQGEILLAENWEQNTVNYCLVNDGFARVNYEGWRIMRDIKEAESRARRQGKGFWQDGRYAIGIPEVVFNYPYGTPPSWISISRWIASVRIRSAIKSSLTAHSSRMA